MRIAVAAVAVIATIVATAVWFESQRWTPIRRTWATGGYPYIMADESRSLLLLHPGPGTGPPLWPWLRSATRSQHPVGFPSAAHSRVLTTPTPPATASACSF